MKKESHLITAVQSNAHLNKQVYETLLFYQKHNAIENLEIIKLRGMDVKEQKLPRGLEKHFILEGGLRLNNNIKISDYKIRPNQIRPFTGLDSFAQGDSSFIFGSPKQYFKTVPTLSNKFPKTMSTTGVITDPRYDERFRINKIARADHKYGAILVDIVNNQLYFQRTLSFQKNGKVIDLCQQYDGSKQPERIELEALVWGDAHFGEHDLQAYECSKNMVKEYQPKKLIIHDFSDCKSINPHEKDDLITLVKKHSEGRDSLENEMAMNAKELKIISELNPSTMVYIVDSNHNDFLKRYLASGQFLKEPHNAYFASKILQGAFEGEIPIKLAMQQFMEIPDNVIFTRPGESVKAGRHELGQHGHKGTNGSRGTANQYAKIMKFSVSAHGHTTLNIRDAYKVGMIQKYGVDYTLGGFNSHAQSNAMVYKRSVQLLHLIHGQYKV